MDNQKVTEALIAFGEWQSLRFPIPTSNLAFTSSNEETREGIKAWATKPNPSNASIIGTYIRAYLMAYRQDEARRKQAAEMDAERMTRLMRKGEIANEVAALRKAMNLSRFELDNFLGLRNGTIQQIENSGTYGIDFFETTLVRVRAAAKAAGKVTA